MRVFSKKRGNLVETVLSPLFVVLVVLTLVFYPLLNYTTSIGKSNYYDREFHTRNLGLLIDALLASPNDLELEYTQKISKLNLEIDNDRVSAYDYEDDPEIAVGKVSSYQIAPSGKTVIYKTALTPRVEDGVVYSYTLSFLKNQDQINVFEKGAVNTTFHTKKTCSPINTKFDEWKTEQKIYLGIIGGVDSTLAKNICTKLSLSLGDSKNLTKGCDTNYLSIQDKKELIEKADPDLLILITTSQKEQTNIYFVSSEGDVEKEKKLSCLITKELIDTNIYTNSLPQEMASAKTLLEGRTGIVIELGNIVSNQLPVIGIKNAIINYYEK